MTLNITIVSPRGIHQSADFRLTDLRATPSGDFLPIADNSPKLVSVTYRHWAGFISYCGIGRWNGRATHDFLREWLENRGPNQDFSQIVEAISDCGSKWMAVIDAALGKSSPHTFIAAGFENGKPRVAFVSNRHTTKGPIPGEPPTALVVSHGSDPGSHVYVTGLDSAVSRASRIQLRRLVDGGAASRAIRSTMARVNALSSTRAEARNGISPSCYCYSLDPLGGGAGELYGSVTGPLAPIQIMEGQDMGRLFESAGLHVGRAQLKSVVFATGASSDAAGAEDIKCDLDIARDEGAGITTHELADLNERTLHIAGANRKGSFVGQARVPVARAPQAFVSTRSGFRLLGTFGGTMSNAMGINEADTVVGAAADGSGTWRAYIAYSDNAMRSLGTLRYNNSAAMAINDAGLVVGNEYQSPAAFAQELHRAFMWTADTGMQAIPGTEDVWSNARAVNSRGQVLGWLGTGGATRGYIWSRQDGLMPLEGVDGRPFYPTAINDVGVVVGEADDKQGVRRGMIWSREDGLRLLGVGFPFHPTDVDNVGNIVGHDAGVPWAAAWLLKADGTVLRLPGGAEHNVSATCIAGQSVYGAASRESWKHQHPIRWDFR